ncbi:fungal-specific transcription factor domain-containing protein [Aspergillus karnatakaensis]|uniref:transcription factor domain-containing protein n=1 Tax=Aspergillus karnatakaensis TaxID=1810916 RepID=UPI003CCCF9D7
MHHTPKRVRTAQAGACSYCVRRKERCYIGVRGIPCTACHRLKIPCDGSVNAEKPARGKRRLPPVTYCGEELFASQLEKTERQQNPRFAVSSPDVAATEPLDNYVSIVQQLLGPGQETEEIESPSRPPLPQYVAALPDWLDDADLQLLQAKGALSLPTTRFRTQLLNSYILWVHPHVPVLDLEPFLRAIIDADGSNTISLLLFHAVMFAGAAFVDISHIHDEGYTSRKAGREALFNRAKALLELHCEEDRLTTVQALLLLVHWQDLQHTKDASHWIGTCLSLAISIGLHRSPDPLSMTTRQQQIWKCTWWSLYNHARLTSEDLLAMMTIEGEHHTAAAPEIVMVELADFNCHTLPLELREVAGGCEVLASTEYQAIQAQLFVEKTKLCRLSQFSSFATGVKDVVMASGNPGTRVCPKMWEIFAARNLEDLQEWHRQLSPAGHHSYPLSLNLTEWEKSLHLYRTWLRLLYLGTSYAAVKEELQQLGDPLLYPFVADYSPLLDGYLVEIAGLFEEVHSLDLSMSLPGPAVSLLVLALTYHRRGLNQPGTNARSAIRLHQCWNMISRLQDVSVLAKYMHALLTDTASTDLWDRLSSALLP